MQDIDRKAKERTAEGAANINAVRGDCPPATGGASLLSSPQGGKTLLERFHKAMEREKKVSLTVRYDADVVRWYKAKGKGYQSMMNAALRAFMEVEQAARENDS